jgi:hypothetical protein
MKQLALVNTQRLKTGFSPDSPRSNALDCRPEMPEKSLKHKMKEFCSPLSL